MFTPKQFAYFMAALYLIFVMLFITTAPVAVALGTGATWFLMLNLAYIAQEAEDMTFWEFVMWFKYGMTP